MQTLDQHDRVIPPTGKIDVDLSCFESFMENSWRKELALKYKSDAILARHAIDKLKGDLKELNDKYWTEKKRTLFTTLDGRVKTEDSFFRKLYRHCKQACASEGFNKPKLTSWYKTIHDLAGVRFSCPYYDEVENAIRNHIRPFLGRLGYATDLSKEGMGDKNYMDEGDKNGYRSYHFFVEVPTAYDVFGATKSVICEIQGRSELQHVWAMKSHDLLYKHDSGWVEVTSKSEILKDMQQLSNHLRAVDHHLTRLRVQIKGE